MSRIWECLSEFSHVSVREADKEHGGSIYWLVLHAAAKQRSLKPPLRAPGQLDGTAHKRLCGGWSGLTGGGWISVCLGIAFEYMGELCILCQSTWTKEALDAVVAGLMEFSTRSVIVHPEGTPEEEPPSPIDGNPRGSIHDSLHSDGFMSRCDGDPLWG